MFHLSDEHQKQVVIWLSGLYGLLCGMILLLSIELRVGIDTLSQLSGILILIAIFVVSCNAGANRLIEETKTGLCLGAKFWYSFIGVFPILVIIVVRLALLV